MVTPAHRSQRALLTQKGEIEHPNLKTNVGTRHPPLSWKNQKIGFIKFVLGDPHLLEVQPWPHRPISWMKFSSEIKTLSLREKVLLLLLLRKQPLAASKAATVQDNDNTSYRQLPSGWLNGNDREGSHDDGHQNQKERREARPCHA